MSSDCQYRLPYLHHPQAGEDRVLVHEPKILRVNHLQVAFPFHGQKLQAVKDISFHLNQSEHCAVLGETGCGKSVMALAVFRLLPRGAIVKGRILFQDRDLLGQTEQEMKQLRGNQLVLVPQSPLSHLNPVLSIGTQVSEAVQRQGVKGRKQIRERVEELLKLVGFPDPGALAHRYPHQLSGGMAQRVLLATGLAGKPKLVVADEPTKGLDVESRDLYLTLTRRLYRDSGVLIITHDLEVATVCDRILVMYAGEIVEDGPGRELLAQPRHPYTKGLIAAHPDRGMTPIPGPSPALTDNFSGCRFHRRCPQKSVECGRTSPEGRLVDGVWVRCIHA